MPDLCGEINKFGKSIGNRARYRILQNLAKGPKTVGQLARAAKCSQPAASQHLNVLKAANLVVDEKRGQEVFYAMNGEYALTLLEHLVTNIVRKRKASPRRLPRH